MSSAVYRRIARIVEPQEVMEGSGVKVKRIIGGKSLRNLDPFLMMDYAKIGSGAGFPAHPHRGFETVSYILSGSSMHEDFKGNYGELHGGDVQWMTAGRGIVHAEMPSSEEIEAFQLWVNLKASDKMCEPAYQEKSNSQLPKASKDGVEVTIIAGESLGVVSEIITRTPAYYLDIRMQANSSILQNIPMGWNSYLFVLNGEIEIEGTKVRPLKAAVLTVNAGKVVVSSNVESRLVLLAGEPIGEPIVNYGPFVMNTEEEIQRTIDDYRTGRNGFEGARNWQPRFIKN